MCASHLSLRHLTLTDFLRAFTALERSVEELKREFEGLRRKFEQGETVNRLGGPNERSS
jgi:hypothetical protein